MHCISKKWKIAEIKLAISSCKSKTDRQYNGQQKKDKKTILKIELQEPPLKTGDENRFSRKVSSHASLFRHSVVSRERGKKDWNVTTNRIYPYLVFNIPFPLSASTLCLHFNKPLWSSFSNYKLYVQNYFEIKL